MAIVSLLWNPFLLDLKKLDEETNISNKKNDAKTKQNTPQDDIDDNWFSQNDYQHVPRLGIVPNNSFFFIN